MAAGDAMNRTTSQGKAETTGLRRIDCAHSMYQKNRGASLIWRGMAAAGVLVICAGCQKVLDTRLFRAAADGDVTLVNSLIESGAHVNAREQEWETPLIYAATEGHPAVVVLFLSKGAEVDAVSMNGETALGRAAVRGEIACVRILVQYGANIERGGARGTTPLMYASSGGQTEVMKFLLEVGAKPNAEDEDGDTALGYAASRESPKQIFDILIAAGADINHKNSRGKSAEILAAENGYRQLAESLKEMAHRRVK